MKSIRKNQNDRLNSAVAAVNRILDDLGLAPGNEIWTIKDACHDCPEQEDHCQSDCKIKEKRYLEKTRVFKTQIEIREDDTFELIIIDEDDNKYDTDDIDVSLFVERNDALEKL